MSLPAFDISVRPLRKGDQEDLSANANDLDIWNNVRDSFPFPYTVEDAENWIALNLRNKITHHFGITVNDHVVGGIGVTPGEDIYRYSAEIGYWLGKNYRGNGIASKALMLVLPYYFNELGLHRIYAGVMAENTLSAAVLTRCGFRQEALIRQNIFKNGRFHDEVVFSLLKTDLKAPGF